MWAEILERIPKLIGEHCIEAWVGISGGMLTHGAKAKTPMGISLASPKERRKYQKTGDMNK